MIQLLSPALNEVTSLPTFDVQAKELLEAGVVNAVAVADAGSTDGTAAVAQAMGYRVLHTDRLSSGISPVLGKGDNVWRGLRELQLSEDDVVVLLDIDVALREPLRIEAIIDRLTDDVELVKADFDRLDALGLPSELRGGRVTEFTARPLLAQVDSALATLGQPLSGQVAFRYGSLLRWRTYSHYGFEIGMLIAAARSGRVAEANIGALSNSDRDLGHLTQVASDVVDGFCAAWTGRLRPGSRIQQLDAGCRQS